MYIFVLVLLIVSHYLHAQEEILVTSNQSGESRSQVLNENQEAIESNSQAAQKEMSVTEQICILQNQNKYYKGRLDLNEKILNNTLEIVKKCEEIIRIELDKSQQQKNRIKIAENQAQENKNILIEFEKNNKNLNKKCQKTMKNNIILSWAVIVGGFIIGTLVCDIIFQRWLQSKLIHYVACKKITANLRNIESCARLEKTKIGVIRAVADGLSGIIIAGVCAIIIFPITKTVE